ncbi:basic proline-rich protein-like [Mesoplodon densirostris]|uniref:basic proline-rich protein-like n=1 Tax=Mesoplodon densirostris TaxID=48708 RepID=UPI0028DCA7E7|nr:basic proline-rich protein-like [Mesoplodon densirostris]
MVGGREWNGLQCDTAAFAPSFVLAPFLAFQTQCLLAYLGPFSPATPETWPSGSVPKQNLEEPSPRGPSRDPPPASFSQDLVLHAPGPRGSSSSSSSRLVPPPVGGSTPRLHPPPGRPPPHRTPPAPSAPARDSLWPPFPTQKRRRRRRPGAKRVESLHAGSPPWLAGARSTRPPFPWRPPPSRDEDSRIVANKSHLAKGEGGVTPPFIPPPLIATPHLPPRNPSLEAGARVSLPAKKGSPSGATTQPPPLYWALTHQYPLLSVAPLTEAAGAREARAQTPRKLAFAAAALPRASLPPLAAPPIYLRPRPRPDPARNSTPLLHPRLPLPSPSPRWSGPAPSAAPPYCSVPSPASAPNSPPAPTPRPVRPGLVSPSRRAPPPNPRPTSPPNSARSGFGPRPGHRSPRFGPVYGHPPRPCLGAGLARCLRPPSRLRRAVLVPVPVPASVPAALPRLATRAGSTQDLNPRGVGAEESKFLYLLSAPAAGPRRPPPFPAPTEPPSPGQSPLAAVATLLFSTLPGKRAKREEEGALGKPEPRRAAADPALATGEERSHLPRPAPGSRKEGGRATPLGGLACGGAPPPDSPPLPRPPTSLTRATSVRGSGTGTEAARGCSPSPGAEVGQVLGKGKCRGSLPRLASPGRPTLRGNGRGCSPPGQNSKGSPRPGRGGIWTEESRGELGEPSTLMAAANL